MKTQLTLGMLINKLEEVDSEKPIYFDFVYFAPNGVHSYRGYYEELAIGYSKEKEVIVKDFLDLLKSSVGKYFTGWKGGEYNMGKDTPVWVSEHRESASTAVVDIEEGDFVYIITEIIE